MTRPVRRRLVAGAAVVLVAGLALAGCGGGDIRSGGGSRTTGGSAGTDLPGGAATAKAYVGLSKKDAIAKAEADGRVWRVTREDGEHFPTTMDYDPTRLNFEIDRGTVTKATFG